MTRRQDFELLRKLVGAMAPRPEQASALRLFEFYDAAIEALDHYKPLYMIYFDSETGAGPLRKDVGDAARKVLDQLDEEIEP